MGSKPAVLHEQHWRDDTFDTTLDVNEMTPEDIREYYRKALLMNLVFACHFGTMPNVDEILGVPQYQALLPLIAESNHQGYQPVPAVRTDRADLLVSRFGKGLGSLLVVANPTMTEQSYHARIDNSWMGAGVALPARTGPEGLSFESNGVTTSFNGRLPRLTPRYYRVSAMVHPVQPLVGQCTMQSHPDRIVYKWTLRNIQPGSILAVYIPDKTIPAAVACNGKPLHFQTNAGAAVCALPDTDVNLTFLFESTVLGMTEAELKSFSFFDDEGTGIPIVLPPRADPWTRRSAKRLRAFFNVWSRLGETPTGYDKPVQLPLIEEPPAETESSMIVLGPLPKHLSAHFDTSRVIRRISISADGRILWIPGKNGRQIEDWTIQLLNLLDNLYPINHIMPSGRLKPAGHINTWRARQKAGLLNAPLTTVGR
jgi:hypothetical protein